MTTLTGLAGILTAVSSQLGVPYSFGGEAPNLDFDCSGLTQWAYSQVGVSIPRTSEAQYASMTPVTEANAKPGDLVFFAGSDGTKSSPGHVGIYIGNGQMVDAPFTGAKVRVDSVQGNVGFRTAPQLASSPSPSTGVLGDIGNGLSSVANVVTGGAVGDVGGVSGLASTVDADVKDLMSAAFWDRVGMGYLGASLVILGFVVFFASSNAGQKAISSGATAAAKSAE